MMVHRPSPAMLVAVTALVVSLGGNSYAAVKLAKNSVNSQAIKDGQVKRADLARNAVGTDQVAARSLLANDFKAGQLPAGPQGPKGDKGEKGLTSFAVRANAGQQPDAVTAPCNPGEVAGSGGAHSFDGVSTPALLCPSRQRCSRSACRRISAIRQPPGPGAHTTTPATPTSPSGSSALRNEHTTTASKRRRALRPRVQPA